MNLPFSICFVFIHFVVAIFLSSFSELSIFCYPVFPPISYTLFKLFFKEITKDITSKCFNYKLIALYLLEINKYLEQVLRKGS